MLYVHNNTDDPFNGNDINAQPGEGIAENVKVGIDLDFRDLDQDGIIRPYGYITADNAEYRTNTSIKIQ